MNKEHMAILTNIIGAVESGGQVYGKRRYDAYAGAHENTPNEVTCTLGWAQNYGNEGRKLCQMILAKDPVAFRRADTADIEGRLSDDWIAQKWNPNYGQKRALIAIISTAAGQKCQDELFEELMRKYIARALEFDPAMRVSAQMMWCEIEHLGGLDPTQRIFKRAEKPYTVDSIMESLKKDQNDTSNNNQVGDKIFQSRHDCCSKWIKQYVKEESNMIYFGSARIDENGDIAGGAAGDQTGREVMQQEYYMHAKGWYRLRPVSATHAEKMAKAMIEACDNNNIGYDQGNRSAVSMVRKYGSLGKVAEKCETDCSNLVRACILQATGKDVGEFYTGNEAAALEQSGLFEKRATVSGMADLKNGDVVVTKSTGHTCIATKGAPRISIPSTADLNKKPKYVAKVKRKTLPVRQYAGKEYPQIEKWPNLAAGNLVDVCATVKASTGLSWKYIRIAGKYYGFVRAKYLEKV